MQINWVEIRKIIFGYCKKAFTENNITYSETEITEAICIFKNFINISSPYAFLNGLSREILPSLQNACIDKVGDIISLKSLLASLDAFLKKTLVLTGTVTYSSINDSHKTLMWLFKESRVSPTFTTNNPTIDESTYSSFIGNSEGVYLFAMSYVARNQIHNSPDWDASEVTLRLKYCLSLYIYIILKYKEKLLIYNSNLNNESYAELFNDDESKVLYNYFSFGKTSITAKTELIESFILCSLYKKGTTTPNIIESDLNKFTQSSILPAAFSRLLENLISKKAIELDKTTCNITLSEDERKRIKEQEENYNANAKLFNDSIDEVLDNFSLSQHKDKLIKKLRAFFEENYNIDINEGCEIESSTTSIKNFQILFTYLKDISPNENTAENLFKALLDVCKANDFLIRLSAGKVFSKISNPDQFSNYISSIERNIYLDTQIILYALCINDNYPRYDNVYYRIARNLVEMSFNKKGIKLLLSNHYLGEITTHLKQALLLIPFTEIKEFESKKISNNVFYSYYFQLKEKDSLPEAIDSFADFMEDMFSLREEDALDTSFYHIAVGVLNGLFPDLNIEIKDIPFYNEDEITNASNIFDTAISTNMLDTKKEKILSNDAIMGCHLFNAQFHNGKDPFFLTYDKSFNFFRKLFIEQYRRGKVTYMHWYLFTPGKFLSHIDFISLKINTDSLTDELLSIMDNSKFREKTKTIVETISRLIDIKNISTQNRRNYIEISKTIFTNEEFPNFIDNTEKEEDPRTKRFSMIVDYILGHYRDKGEEFIDSFKAMLSNKDYFSKTIDILKLAYDSSEISNDSIVSQIDELMIIFIQYKKNLLEEKK